VNDVTALAIAAFGATGMGFFPIAIWLVFWLVQDWRHPEPRTRLLAAFFTGMASVPIVLSLEGLAAATLPYGYLLLFIWASIEEVVKVVLAYVFILRHRSVDEPLDFPVYLITVALGFAAVENTLFLFAPLLSGGVLESAVTGNLRFIGPTLIHVLDAAIIGAAMSFAFFRSNTEKIYYTLVGVILAAALHTFFNFLIITTGAGRVLTVFLGVWVAIIFMLLALERIKLLRPPAWWEKVFISTQN
jgi:RsiW-degrading membrane proteinase PrsW (M82 family)